MTTENARAIAQTIKTLLWEKGELVSEPLLELAPLSEDKEHVEDDASADDHLIDEL
jgi:hypothetical protein